MSDNNQPDVGPYRQRFSQIATMMRLPHVEDAAGLDIAFAGVPFDMGVFFRPGARLGPSQIREMSRMLRAVHTANHVAPFDLCQVADVGDAPVNPMNVEGSIDRITDFFADPAAKGVTPLAMGGCHTIPVPILRDMKAGGAIAEPVAMIHFDAHADVLQTGPAFDGTRSTTAPSCASPSRKAWSIRPARSRSVCAAPSTRLTPTTSPRIQAAA
jgi:arginase family enzyme